MSTFCRLFLYAFSAVVFPFIRLQKWRKGNRAKNIDLTTVGGRLKSKRIAMVYTQEELAEELMIKANMISGYEGNKGIFR